MAKKKSPPKETKKTKEEQSRLKRWLTSYRKLPNKKPYVEFFTALLSIPVLLTVVLLNYNTLTANKNAKPEEPTKSVEQIFVYPTGNEKSTDTTKPETETNTVVVTQEACKKQIGPVSISSPREGETVSDSPVSLNISYDDNEYCTVVWSYRINGGKWSDYDNKSIALYNLPQGNIKIELKVKSTVSSEEKSLTRSFIYKPDNSSTPIPTQASN